MRIVQRYSHLNGEEWLRVHKPSFLGEIEGIVAAVKASDHKTMISNEQTMLGRRLYNPASLNNAFTEQLLVNGWRLGARTYHYTCEDADTTSDSMGLELQQQKDLIETRGFEPIKTFNESDFEKEGVSIEVQFGKYAFVQFDIFIKHAASYMQGKIDLGVEIVPMKSLEREMSSGPSYFEKNLHEILRQGRIFPPVPLILIGIDA